MLNRFPCIKLAARAINTSACYRFAANLNFEGMSDAEKKEVVDYLLKEVQVLAKFMYESEVNGRVSTIASAALYKYPGGRSSYLQTSYFPLIFLS